MLKTLALKELRETAGIAVVALILLAGCVVDGMGVPLLPLTVAGGGTIPFVGDPLVVLFAGIAVLLAVALGFRQTAWESALGTDLFLLHRPVRRGQLIGVKLAVGVSLILTCPTIPILVYAWWAATPGTHASPFEWSMTEPFWRIPLVVTIVYLGSFLSGIRPARWVGTKLVPLAAAGLLASLAGALVPVAMILPGWWIWWAGSVAVFDVVLGAGIFLVLRTRDF